MKSAFDIVRSVKEGEKSARGETIEVEGDGKLVRMKHRHGRKKCEKLLVFCCEWDNTTHTREWSLLPIWMVHREMRNDHKRAQSSHKIAAAKNYPTTCWSLFMEPSSAALASTKALNANGVIVGALEIVFFLESNSRNAQFPCAQVFTINSLDSHSLRAPENFFLISFNSQKKLWALSHLSLGLTRLSRAEMTTR